METSRASYIKTTLQFIQTTRVSAKSLIFFRMIFGCLLACGAFRQWYYGWIESLYLRPQFFFPYEGLEFIAPYSRELVYGLFSCQFIFSITFGLGIFQRLSAALVFIAFTYLELVDKTSYLNHYYLVSLILFLFIFLPTLPKIWSKNKADVPIAWLYLLRSQFGLVYFFAGVAKLGSDWLIHAQPLKIWLPSSGHIPLLNPVLEWSFTPYLASWAGALFDLTIVFFLLNSRARPLAFLVVIGFHSLTWILFPIGLFPWIMILGASLFFPPNWPDTVLRNRKPETERRPMPNTSEQRNVHPLILSFIGIHLLVQLILPLRHVAYPGRTLWTEEGFRFSWKVMLIEKAGYARFRVVYQDGSSDFIGLSDWLTPLQIKMMSTQADMIVQFAHFLGTIAFEKTVSAVYVESFVSFNGRRAQRFIPDDLNLLTISSIESYRHIISLDTAAKIL
ncbi:MAG: HTTM domain-containing protein [Pseudobacteriovorax sp.]|nr:HTTM domain-containing protein [Pseudobacteriovorax sp.]